MSISKKPRHWIALAIAFVTMIVALIAFADFSGEPTPRWREIGMLIGAPLTVVAVVYNLLLDGKE